MKNYKIMLGCLLLNLVVMLFGLFSIIDTGSAMFFILIVFPIVHFITSFIVTKKNSNPFIYLLLNAIIIVALLSMETVDLLVYVAPYIGVSIFGVILGFIFKPKGIN